MSPTKSTKQALATVLLVPAMATVAWSTPILDTFSTDTSANYTGSDSFGSGGSFTVSSGSLNLTPAGGNTYSVVHTTSNLEVGESYSVDLLDPPEGSGNSGGGDGQFLMLTSGTVQPNGSSIFGFRLRVDD